jgi:cell wall-associated NlpC family hydrolase
VRGSAPGRRPPSERDFPLRQLRQLLVVLVLLGVALGGVDQPAADATPARRIARLRAKAARVQAAIDRMHARVEGLVENYDEVHEALAATQIEQERTRRRGHRRPPPAGGQAAARPAAVDHPHRRSALDRVERLRREVEGRLAAQRRYHQRLTRELRRAVAAERRRQEALRRQALARRMAAERAARAAAARSGAAWAGRAGRAGAPTGAARRAVAFARSQLGKPYVWGASGPSSYDCSGLVMAAYRRAGVWLPRVSRSQWHAGRRVGLGGLAPGDLVFFAYDVGNPATIHHVGMYIGGGAMVEAPYSGARVRVASIGRRDYIGAVRPTG